MLSHWWYKLLHRNARPSAHRARRARARAVPTVEALEDRSLLASLSIPTSFTGQPGDTVTVPVNLDASDGLQSATVAISWDTARLQFLSAQQGSVASGFTLSLPLPDAQAGTAKISLEADAPISGRGSGSLVRLNFRVKADAPPGPAIVNLRQNVDTFFTQLNGGGLPLSPAPDNIAGDALDGRITVPGTPPVTPAGVTITETDGSTTVSEDGATDSYTVVLDRAPTATVTIQLQAPADQVVLSPTQLQFTAANWNVPQTVTVRAVDDTRAEGNHSVNITHTVTSADLAYNGLAVRSVQVNIIDNGPNDFTSLLTVKRGGLRRKGSTYQQTVIITNRAGNPALAGPITVVLNNLNTRARLRNASGVTQVLAPLGRPFVQLTPGADNVLSAGETLRFTLVFARPSTTAVFRGFTLAVLAGEGRR
jgi:hypothetical protein